MMVFSNRFFLKNLFLRGILTFIVAGGIFCTTPTAHAGVWGESIAGVMLDNIINIIKEQLKGAILGTLKVAATEIINSNVGHMVGGKSPGDALFVVDWDNFLYEKPAQQVNVFMDDFFSKVTVGKNAQANYTGVGDSGYSKTGNYASYLTETAKASTGDDMVKSVDFDEYEVNPDAMFDNGNFMALDAFIKNPMNNPIGFVVVSEQIKEKTLLQQIEAVKTQLTSSGFIAPKDKNGNVIAPVATIQNMQKDAMNIGNTLIAAATNPGEFLAGVVNAVVSKAVTSMVQKGVGKIQARIKKEIQVFDKKVMKELSRADKKLGPAAKFLKETNQKTDTYIKPYTPPPPPPACPTDRVRGGC